MITDPPCSSAVVSISWTHGKSRSIRGDQYCNVDNPNGVTLGNVFDAVLHKEGSVGYMKGERWEQKNETTLDNVIQMLGETKRKPVMVGYSVIRLRGIVIPTDEEWQRMM